MKPAIKLRTLADFNFENGCDLASNAGVIEGIYIATRGYPCNDCGCKPCKQLDQFVREDAQNNISQRINPGAISGLKTNAELAVEYGITKRQAAKRRITGTNELQAAV